MSKKKVIKKSISLREDVFNIAEDMADKLFGGNFSAYLTYLICADKHGVSVNTQTNTEEEKENRIIDEKEIKKEKNSFTKSEEHSAYIDELLNM